MFFDETKYIEHMERLINYISGSITDECLLHGCSGDIRNLQKHLKVLSTFVSESRIAKECLCSMSQPPYTFMETPVTDVVKEYIDNQTDRPCSTDYIIRILENTVSKLLDMVTVCKTRVKAHVNSEYDLGEYYNPKGLIRMFQDIVDEKDSRIFKYQSMFDVKYESIPDTNSYLTKEELEELYSSSLNYDPEKELEDLKKLGWIIPKE